MAKKKKAGKEIEDVRKVLFSADLILMGLDKFKARYRMVNPRGLDVGEIHHPTIARKELPMDDSFNMDFLNKDLKNPELPPDPNEVLDEVALDIARKKQAKFKVWQNLKIVITTA